jgi:hypothetical protein
MRRSAWTSIAYSGAVRLPDIITSILLVHKDEKIVFTVKFFTGRKSVLSYTNTKLAG